MKQLIYRLTEPAMSIPDVRKLFSDHDLKLLILPFFLDPFPQRKVERVPGDRIGNLITEDGISRAYDRLHRYTGRTS